MEVKKETLKEQNARHQREFKARQKAKDLEKYREQKREEMKTYRAKRKAAEDKLNPPKVNNIPPKTIEIPKVEPPTRAKKQRGKPKTKLVENPEIVPLYKRTNKPLEQSSVDDYVSKLNIINELMTSRQLHQGTKREVIKLLEGKDYYQTVIDANLKYIKNITEVVKKLREKYQNDKTFRNYINVLVVILSRIPKYNTEYQQLSKINIQLSQEYKQERDKNEVSDEDNGKIFSYEPEDIKANIDKLTDINEKMLYVLSIYLLRRLEIRTLILSMN